MNPLRSGSTYRLRDNEAEHHIPATTRCAECDAAIEGPRYLVEEHRWVVPGLGPKVHGPSLSYYHPECAGPERMARAVGGPEIIDGCTRDHWRSNLAFHLGRVAEMIRARADEKVSMFRLGPVTTAELVVDRRVREARRLATLIGEPEPFPDLPPCPPEPAKGANGAARRTPKARKGKAKKAGPTPIEEPARYFSVSPPDWSGPVVYFLRVRSAGFIDDLARSFVDSIHPDGHRMGVSSFGGIPPIGSHVVEVPADA